MHCIFDVNWWRIEWIFLAYRHPVFPCDATDELEEFDVLQLEVLRRFLEIIEISLLRIDELLAESLD